MSLDLLDLTWDLDLDLSLTIYKGGTRLGVDKVKPKVWFKYS